MLRTPRPSFCHITTRAGTSTGPPPPRYHPPLLHPPPPPSPPLLPPHPPPPLLPSPTQQSFCITDSAIPTSPHFAPLSPLASFTASLPPYPPSPLLLLPHAHRAFMASSSNPPITAIPPLLPPPLTLSTWISGVPIPSAPVRGTGTCFSSSTTTIGTPLSFSFTPRTRCRLWSSTGLSSAALTSNAPLAVFTLTMGVSSSTTPSPPSAKLMAFSKPPPFPTPLRKMSLLRVASVKSPKLPIASLLTPPPLLPFGAMPSSSISAPTLSIPPPPPQNSGLRPSLTLPVFAFGAANQQEQQQRQPGQQQPNQQHGQQQQQQQAQQHQQQRQQRQQHRATSRSSPFLLPRMHTRSLDKLIGAPPPASIQLLEDSHEDFLNIRHHIPFLASIFLDFLGLPVLGATSTHHLHSLHLSRGHHLL
ncbi:unnamed protein product [Closterium sp. NIES-54]